VPRARLFPALSIVLIGGTALAGVVRAQNGDSHPPQAGLSEMALPGSLRAALAVIRDPTTPDRSQFFLEVIRRFHHAPVVEKDGRASMLPSLLAQLDLPSPDANAIPGQPETLPLPLSPAIWTDVVFAGRATPQSLARAILSSRNAALLYYGLLSLDDATRGWLAEQRPLLLDLVARHAGAFAVAAPGLRVANGVVRVPGGDAARPAWEVLAGHRVSQPADFVRALLANSDDQLAQFFAAMAQLTPAQVRFALNLDSPDAEARVETTRRLHRIFARTASDVERQTIWRTALDPALLAADLRADDSGRPRLPGTRRFWNAVFAGTEARRGREDAPRELAEGEPVDFAWLCERIFESEQAELRRRYFQVLFASRIVSRVTPDTVGDKLVAVSAARDYPALVMALERMGIADEATIAGAVRRAAQLSAIDDETRAARALAQFQGALVIVARAASRGSLKAESLSSLVSSLSAVELNERGEYESRLVRWLDEHLRAQLSHASNGSTAVVESSAEVYERAAGPVERDLLRLLAGSPATTPRFVDWEGTRYRVDLPWAEATRLVRLLGEHPLPYLTSARSLLVLADAIGNPSVTRERLKQAASQFEQVARAIGWNDEDGPWRGTETLGSSRAIAAELRRIEQSNDLKSAPRLATSLHLLADDLLARGLSELAYAVALGQPDAASISAGEAASRHDFGRRSFGASRHAPWQLPVAGADGLGGGWRVTGSLLGLDIRLSQFSLMRLSVRLPTRRPTLPDDCRRVFVEGAALVESARLTDADRDAIVAALEKGRARLAGARTPNEVRALAEEINLAPARRSLLPWVFAHDPKRLATFLSPIELFWLGLQGQPVAARLNTWGAPAEPRLGCLCLQLLDRRPLEMLAGRWGTGMLPTGFPDLNLRLAELLADMQMPASLLGPVLASATLDFINTASSRDPDDRRGLVEFVQALNSERLERYLALLTTDGPLVPVGEVSGPTPKTGAP
jgi:hypothetical protein